MDCALRSIYGEDPLVLSEQRRRYARALWCFAAQYGSGEVAIYRSPGRVNLIGEHTDYNHGYVMPMALDKDVLVLARRRSDAVVRLANLEESYAARTWALSTSIPPRPIGDWANYAQGPAQLLEAEHGPGLCGCDALVDGAPPLGVPRSAGLSSSSALTVATAVALAGVNGLALSGAPLAEACSRAEWYVGTRGGIMDQFVAILAQRSHALFLDCRPAADGAYVTRQVCVPPGCAVMVVDSGVHHRNTGPHFNRRVAEGRIGVRLLQRALGKTLGHTITHLRDVQGVPWPELEPLLPEVVQASDLRARGIEPDTILDSGVGPATDTFFVRRRCRHVHSENGRVLASVVALEQGDMATFGRLLAEAHASARDDYEISTPEIEVLVRVATALPGTVGARLTGAGWGGCVVAIVPEENAAAFGAVVVADYRRETGLEARVFGCRSAAGAGLAWQTAVGKRG